MRLVLASALLGAVTIWGTGCNGQPEEPAEPIPPADPGLEPGPPGGPGPQETPDNADAYPPAGQSGQMMPPAGDRSAQREKAIELPPQENAFLEDPATPSPRLIDEDPQFEIDDSAIDLGEPSGAFGGRYDEPATELGGEPEFGGEIQLGGESGAAADNVDP